MLAIIVLAAVAVISGSAVVSAIWLTRPSKYR
jgi:hypothetical protein